MRIVSSCRLLMEILEKSAVHRWRAESGGDAARAAVALHCHAAPTAYVDDVHKCGGQRRHSDGCRTLFF
jgi:hypothetical protein